MLSWRLGVIRRLLSLRQFTRWESRFPRARPLTLAKVYLAGLAGHRQVSALLGPCNFRSILRTGIG